MSAVRFLESVRVGLDSLREHPTRTLLSTSGVVIGVLALVSALSVIDGVDRWSRYLIERESSVQDLVLARRRPEAVEAASRRAARAPVFTLEDWRAATRTIPHISAALLMVTAPAHMVANGRRRQVLLTSSTANLPAFTAIQLLDGRFFSEMDVHRDAPVAVLGYRLAEELAQPRDPLWLIGQIVRIGTARREVIGILAGRPGESDLVAFTPIGGRGDFHGVSADALQPVLRLKATSVEDVPAARAALIDWVASRYPTMREGLEVTVGLERLNNTRQGILLTKLIFGFLVMLMLAIGGIGIMNVLLASVAERTREIGIRKAVGAQHRDVLLHVLAESVAIAGTGGVVGVMLGAALAEVATAVFRQMTGADIRPVFSSVTVTAAALSAVAVGLIFGTYPALRAARLTPIEAIHREG